MEKGPTKQYRMVKYCNSHGIPSAAGKRNENRCNAGPGYVSESFAIFRLASRTDESSSDSVRSKFQKGIGISFSEFAYPLLQAWDWWHLHQSKGITVQIGGADQFGNIMAGIDAVKHILKSHPDPDIRDTEEKLHMKPMGFTVPLLTTASGEKFGKSAGNAVWLDKNTTSVFDQYQVCVYQLENPTRS